MQTVTANERREMITANRFAMIAAEKLQQQLLHAIAMERRSATRVKRAATLLHKWQRTRQRIERRIGQAEVDRIVNSAAAIEEITQKKNTVRKVIRRLSESK